MRRSGPAARSPGLRWPSKPAATASGWRAGLRRGVEAHVIHASSLAVSREHRRAKTDRLDTELLKRGFLGWLRGERGHCSMARMPTMAEEDAKRANRERDCLEGERTRIVNRKQ